MALQCPFDFHRWEARYECRGAACAWWVQQDPDSPDKGCCAVYATARNTELLVPTPGRSPQADPRPGESRDFP